MTAEPVLMLTPRCPPLYTTRLRCVGCCLLFVLCSPCVFFLLPPSLQPGTQTPAQNNAFFFFFFLSEIWLRDFCDGGLYVSVSVQVLAGSWAAPGSCGRPAPAGARGPPAVGK